MQRAIHTNIQLATTTPNYESNTPGKSPNPYHHFAHFNTTTYGITQQFMYIIPTLKKSNTFSSTHKKNLSSHTELHKIINYTSKQILHNNYNKTHISSTLLYKARLHAQKGGGEKSITLNTHQNLSCHCAQQMANRGKAVHDAIMSNPIDTDMDTEDTMVIETTLAKRTQ